MVYASASEGFRAGAAQQYLPFCAAPALPADAITHLRSDSLWSYELGVKSRLPSGVILSAAAFHIDWKDLQQQVALPCGAYFASMAASSTSRVDWARTSRSTEAEASNTPLSLSPEPLHWSASHRDPASWGLRSGTPRSRSWRTFRSRTPSRDLRSWMIAILATVSRSSTAGTDSWRRVRDIPWRMPASACGTR